MHEQRRCNDFALFKRSLDLVPKNLFILADKGHREINKRRIGIKHVFSTLKTFKILAERNRNR